MASVFDFLTEMAGKVGGGDVAGPLGELSAKLGAEEAALKRLEESLRRMQGGSSVDIEAFKKLQEQIGVKKDSIAGLDKELMGLQGSAEGAAGGTEGLTGALSKLGPEGQAIAVILAVVTTIIIGLVSHLWELSVAAIAISQEKDALAATFAALSDGAAAGSDLVDSISAVAAALPFAESKVLAWGKALMAVGLQGGALERAINAVASANALMGEAGGAAAEGLLKRFAMMAETGQKVKLDRRILSQLAAAGVSASSLAEALGVPVEKLGSMAIQADKLGDAMQSALIKKGAAALETMSLKWSTISAKLSDAWEDLFEDLGPAVQPLMKEVRDFFALFSAGSATQSAAKGILTAFFTNLFSIATRVVHAIRVGFIWIATSALQVTLMLAPIIKLFRQMFSNAMVLKGIVVILALIAAPFVIIGILIAGVIIALVAIGTVIAAVASAVVAGVSWLVGTIVSGISAATEAVTGWASSAWAAAGNFIDGLVGGITAGIGRVVGAVSAIGSSIKGAITGVLQIRSPSVFARKIGLYFDQGLEHGVDEGKPDVHDAMTEVATPPDIAQGGRTGRRGRGASGPTLIIERLELIGESAREIWDELEPRLLALLDSVDLQGPDGETT